MRYVRQWEQGSEVVSQRPPAAGIAAGTGHGGVHHHPHRSAARRLAAADGKRLAGLRSLGGADRDDLCDRLVDGGDSLDHRHAGIARRSLLLAAIAGFAIANTVTTVSTIYALTMLARFLAGVSAGLLWALLAGYAARLVPAHQKGRAIAVAMVGTPLALSLGVPAGAFLGTLVSWRVCFGIMSVLALLLMVWVRLQLADFAGQARDRQQRLGSVLMLPGIRSVLLVVLAFVLAHNILYTYIAAFLAQAGMAERIDLVLLVFGGASVVGIWIVGVLIDRHLRVLTLISIGLFGAAALALGLAGDMPATVYAAVGAWGLAFGGSATLFQTALATSAGADADVAQSMLVTA